MTKQVETETPPKIDSKTEGVEFQYVGHYTSRDLILYALGIGCRPDHNHDELKYLYEHHERFGAFPTFPLTLPFRAAPCGDLASFSDIQQCHLVKMGAWPFPPPSLQSSVIPRNLLIIPQTAIHYSQEQKKAILRSIENDLNDLFLLHISQKVRLHSPLPLPSLSSSHTQTDLNHNHKSIPIQHIEHSNDAKPQILKYDAPIPVHISTKLLSVIPKSIGTFVTTETQCWIPHYATKHQNYPKSQHNNHNCNHNHHSNHHPSSNSNQMTLVSTSQMTSLLLSAPKDSIRTFHHHSSSSISSLQPPSLPPPPPSSSPPTPPDTRMDYKIDSHQALLYRLSGDYNPIHVDASLLPPFLSPPDKHDETQTIPPKPILHGLCTLGYAVRSILAHCHTIQSNPNHPQTNSAPRCELTYVECRFASPTMVGDALSILIWNVSPKTQKKGEKNENVMLFRFRVVRTGTEMVLVDGGVAQVEIGGMMEDHPPVTVQDDDCLATSFRTNHAPSKL